MALGVQCGCSCVANGAVPISYSKVGSGPGLPKICSTNDASAIPRRFRQEARGWKVEIHAEGQESRETALRACMKERLL
jgi:hypothetical protein